MAEFEHSIRCTITNRSDYPIDFVWENAQDMEHIGFLHRNTNFDFSIVDLEPDLSNKFLYQSLSYLVKRKMLGFLPLNTFGHRKIISKYELWQVEYCPFLGISTFLRSTLKANSKNPDHTDMIDYVEIFTPSIYKYFGPIFTWSLKRHARKQCLEDEPFRMRRKELYDRNLNIPPSILQKTIWEKVTNNYLAHKKQENLDT